MELATNLTTLVDKIQEKPEGITLSFGGEVPPFQSGFYVATTDHRVARSEIPQIVCNIVGNTARSEEIYLGSWQADDGFFCIDEVLYIEDQSQAMQLAVKYDQEAIFDIGKKVVIPTDYGITDIN